MSTYRDQKRAPDSLDLELQELVCGVQGTKFQSSVKLTDIHNGRAIFTVPLGGSKDNPGREQRLQF